MLPKHSPSWSWKIASITWILIGLMIGGSLFDYLAATQQTSACVELRILEQEDDRADISDMVFVHEQSAWSIGSLGRSEDVSEADSRVPWIGRQAARYQRGPPMIS